MGLEARCHGRCGDEAGEGKLQLESAALQFRGAFRLDVPVAELKKADADGEELVVKWGRRTASFTVGSAVAPKWVHKILHPPSLLDKLGVKAGQSVGVKGAFDEAFLASLPALGKKPFDVLLQLAATPPDLGKIPALAATLAPAGALWIVYAKGGKPLAESQVREAAMGAGLVDVKVCAFSATHTAAKWVRPRAKR